jgi:hypothetical protein
LEGTAAVSSGKLEVDADRDDPLIANNVEFDINSPEFSAQDYVDISVTG